MGHHSNFKISNQAPWHHEFSAFNPDPACASQEEMAEIEWKKAYQLDMQHYPLMRQMPDSFPFPQFIAQMLEAAWKPASASQKQPQKFMAGQHRAAAVTPSIQKAAVYHAPQLHYGLCTDARIQGIAKDWCRMKEFQRVEGYAFRGDKRDPMTVKAHGGFMTPATRTDDYYLDMTVIPNFKIYMKNRFGEDNLDEAALRKYIKGGGSAGLMFIRYECWRAMMQQESLHLGRMIASEFLKGYTSTTRATSIAKMFAVPNGWVYALYVKGAFLIGGKGTHDWIRFGEQELAMPGSVEWQHVFGFREVGDDLNFTGPIYLRKHFHGQHKDSFEKVFELLSGKRQ
jgi:hypothetical protein